MTNCSVCGEDRPCRCKLTPSATGGYVAPDATQPELSAQAASAGPATPAKDAAGGTKPCGRKFICEFKQPRIPLTDHQLKIYKQIAEMVKEGRTFNMTRPRGMGKSRAIPPKTED